MQTGLMTERQTAILDAAFQAFATYGYRRTTMDDIGRAAGLSRTALYLHYRNKEQIFRSMTLRYFEQALADMQTALNRPGLTTEQALLAGLIAKDGKFMEVVLTTPHGTELMDAGFSVSGDLAATGEARVAEMLSGWLSDRGVPDDLGPARALADIIMAAMKGLKASVRSLEELRAGEARLAALIARALA
jgi:AcrR family transcriptional regulator